MEMQQYLQETTYCDCNDPLIKKTAERFMHGGNSPAVGIFSFVRDSYPLCADAVKVKASETAKKGYGACWNKALVMIALLRSCGVPSRMVMRPLDKEFLRPLLGGDVLLLNNPYYHCYVQVLAHGAWISADPSLDTRTFEALYRPAGVAWSIEWDGREDHVIHDDKSMGPMAVVDDIDRAIGTGFGNRPTPGFIMPMLNRKYWKKTGWYEYMKKK